ncbi:MAG: AAA family ATPase [Clostridia bacterium]|nr:AAA family ATPase [Clostridia bacterium]
MIRYDTIIQHVRKSYPGFTGQYAGIPAARKFVLEGKILTVKTAREFTALVEEHGVMECRAMIDALDTEKYKSGTTVYMLCVIAKGKKQMHVLYMTDRITERSAMIRASFILSLSDIPLSADRDVLANPDDLPDADEFSPELEGLAPQSRAFVTRIRQSGETAPKSEHAASRGKIPVKDVKKVYELCKDYLDPAVRSVISDLMSATRFQNTRAEQRARILLSIQTIFEQERVSSEELREQLDASVYGMQEVKDAVCESVTACALSEGDYSLRILLIGPKGVGKEEMALAIARARQKPYAVIPYGCFSSLPDAGGCSSLYDGSKPGAFAEAFFEEGTTDMTLILSSIDTASGKQDEKNGDPNQILQEMLKGKLCDQFLECPIDVSHTWMIAMATNEEDISPQILSGFDRVFYIEPLSDESDERLYITQHFLLPRLLRMFRLNPDKTYFSTAQLRYLLRELCYDQGMDRMDNYLRSLLLYMVSHRKKKLKTEQIDQILHKDRILRNPAAIVSRNITYFDKTDRKIVRKYIETCEFGTGDRKKNAQCIVDGLAELFRNTVPITPFDYADYMECLDKSHSGLLEPKFAGARMISRQTNSRGHSGKNVLFHGPPGVGKTTLLRSVARAANNLPFRKIACNGVSEASFFKGTGHSFKDVSFGKVLETLCSTGLHALILLDEIDKIATTSAMAALLDLLDEKRFYDNYAGVSIDVSSVIFCASANDISRVPQPLLDRFEIIELPGYSYDQKALILREHLLPETLAEYGNPEIEFTPEAETLLVKYCKGAGARDLMTNLQKVVESVLLEHGNAKYVVTADDLTRYLGPVPVEHTMSTKLRPGLAHGLAVGGYGGFVTDILIVHSKHDKVTGLVEGSCRESVEVARTAAATICAACEDAPYHIHFGVGQAGVRKEGSSAGVTLALGMLSCETNTPIDPYSAFTGELSPAGDICAVGGVPVKIQAAIDQGCTRVFIPRDNYNSLRQEDLAHFEAHLEVIPVDTLEDVYSRAMITSKQAVS